MLENENVEEDQNEEEVKRDAVDLEAESITLQKVDGKWKVVYSDLNFVVNNSGKTNDFGGGVEVTWQVH